MNDSDAHRELRTADEIITQIELLERERVRAATVAAAHEATTNLKRSIEERDLERIAVEREYELKIQEIGQFTSKLRHCLLARQETESRGGQAGVEGEFEVGDLKIGGQSRRGSLDRNVEEVHDALCNLDDILNPQGGSAAARMNSRNCTRGMASTYPSPEPYDSLSTLYSPSQPIKFGIASQCTNTTQETTNSAATQTRKTPRDDEQQDLLPRKKQKSAMSTAVRTLRPSASGSARKRFGGFARNSLFPVGSLLSNSGEERVEGDEDEDEMAGKQLVGETQGLEKGISEETGVGNGEGGE